MSLNQRFHPVVPEGGILKVTSGTWHQVFDSDGRCVWQEFVSGDAVEYEDESGKRVTSGDKRLSFYHPFIAIKPQAHCPQFKCPGCGSNRLEEILVDATFASEIVNVGPGGDLEYGASGVGDSGTVDRYQCVYCGDVVQDASGHKVQDCVELAKTLGVTV